MPSDAKEKASRSSGQSTKAPKTKKPGKFVGLDSYDQVLRIAVGDTHSISLSERLHEISLSELETSVPRLSSYVVLATEESHEQIKAVEQLGLKIERLPRVLALYWGLRDRLKDEPTLVLSMGPKRTSAGLVIDEVLDRAQDENSALTLHGIWTAFIESNGLLKKISDSYGRKNPAFSDQIFEAFVSVLKSGERASVGPIAFSPPFDFGSSLDAILQLFKAVDPDGLARTVILGDWAATHCNLPDLLSQVYTSVLRPEPERAFVQAAKGLISYGLAEKGSPGHPLLDFSPKEILFLGELQNGSSQADLKIKNEGGGVLRANLLPKDPWLTVLPGRVICRKGEECVVRVRFDAKGLPPGRTFATDIQIRLDTGGQSNAGIKVIGKIPFETLAPLPSPQSSASTIAEEPRVDAILDLPPFVKDPPIATAAEPNKLATLRTIGSDSADELELPPLPPNKTELVPMTPATVGPKFVRSTSSATSSFFLQPRRFPWFWIAGLLVVAAIGVTVTVISLTRRANIGDNGNRSTPTPVRPVVPPGMVLIPGGEFQMGSDRPGADPQEKPAHRATVGPFYIDATEVTCEDYQKFVKATGHKTPPKWVDRTCPSGETRKPVTGVDWYDATAYAKWANKRLPTEEEWEFAARGKTGWIYPWGNEWKKDAANAGGAAKGIVDVGSFNGASPFKTYDMVGNAWEWTSSKLLAYPGGKLEQSGVGEFRVIRGGSWQSETISATTTYRFGWPASGKEDYSNTSFRCAQDVPSSEPPARGTSPTP